MAFQDGIKFKSMVEFWDYLPENERIITDVLRQIVLEILPPGTREKLTYNVPFFYGKRRICLIWPSSVPWGGFKSGVMFGLCQGNRLKDQHQYLTHGTNKQFFYKIFNSPEDLEKDYDNIVSILKEAVAVDARFN